jgi:non-ribosomal peptide synthetase component F
VEDIRRLARQFHTLLESALSRPSAPIIELTMLSEMERRQLLIELNDTKADYPGDKCIHQVFEEQARRTPYALAVVFEDEKLTYDELNRRSNRLAHHLRSLGTGPEVMVGLCVERSMEMVVGLLGILKAGGAYVPLDPMHPNERLTYMLEDAQVRE